MNASRTFRALWTRQTEEDLAEIADYLAARDGPDRALEVVDRINDAVETLRHSPNRAKPVDYLRMIGVTRFRQLLVRPWLVIFCVEAEEQEEVVMITSVLDGRRDLEALLTELVLRRSD